MAHKKTFEVTQGICFGDPYSGLVKKGFVCDPERRINGDDEEQFFTAHATAAATGDDVDSNNKRDNISFQKLNPQNGRRLQTSNESIATVRFVFTSYLLNEFIIPDPNDQFSFSRFPTNLSPSHHVAYRWNIFVTG